MRHEHVAKTDIRQIVGDQTESHTSKERPQRHRPRLHSTLQEQPEATHQYWPANKRLNHERGSDSSKTEIEGGCVAGMYHTKFYVEEDDEQLCTRRRNHPASAELSASYQRASTVSYISYRQRLPTFMRLRVLKCRRLSTTFGLSLAFFLLLRALVSHGWCWACAGRSCHWSFDTGTVTQQQQQQQRLKNERNRSIASCTSHTQ